ncbi:MAG TPA: hemerythrin domain-containing protein [Thermoanaerobaculia bacterium]|nr:hemerythrin domain-containing protein [Thermoanaerobaculia bacterium]
MVPTPAKTLVCRRLPAGELRAALLSAFDGLGLQETLLLLSDQPHAPVLRLLQTERPGAFEWSPLATGPPEWQTEVTRRAAARALRELTEALSWDHDRLDELWRAAIAARSAGDSALAQRAFERFAHGFKRHLRFEEALLFPEFERLAGSSVEEGLTGELRAEHRALERCLAALARGLSALGADLGPVQSEFQELLAEHHAREERVLLPATDRLLAADERDELVRRIQAFEEDSPNPG